MANSEFLRIVTEKYGVDAQRLVVNDLQVDTPKVISPFFPITALFENLYRRVDALFLGKRGYNGSFDEIWQTGEVADDS